MTSVQQGEPGKTGEKGVVGRPGLRVRSITSVDTSSKSATDVSFFKKTSVPL